MVEVTVEDAVVVLSVTGCLDAQAGFTLLWAATAAVAQHAQRLDVDLQRLQSFTPDGARALADCRRVSAGLPHGLHYRTGRGAGREALLAAYSTS